MKCSTEKSLHLKTNHKHHWDWIIMMQSEQCTHEDSMKHPVCSNYIQRLKRKTLHTHKMQHLIKSNCTKNTAPSSYSDVHIIAIKLDNAHFSSTTFSSFNSLFAGWSTNIRHDTSESSLFSHLRWSCLVYCFRYMLSCHCDVARTCLYDTECHLKIFRPMLMNGQSTGLENRLASTPATR